MRYKLFLFHADMFSAAIVHVLQEGRDKNGWLKHLLPFPAAASAAELAEQLRAVTPPSGTLYASDRENVWELRTEHGTLWKLTSQRINTQEELPPEHGHLLTIRLDWHFASRLIPAVLDFACRHNFYLADVQRPDPFLWSPNRLGHTEIFQCRERSRELVATLEKRMTGLRNIVKIADWTVPLDMREEKRMHGYAAYAVVLSSRKACAPRDLGKKAEELCTILKETLRADERLMFHDRFFWVNSEKGGYETAFCLEGYGKNPSMTAHMDAPEDDYRQDLPGSTTIEPLRRLGALKLKRRAQEFFPENPNDSPIARRMMLRDMVFRFPDPGMRLAASIHMEKQCRVMGNRLRYDVGGRYEGDVFGLEDIPYDALLDTKEHTGTLYVESSLFNLLLPAIDAHVPGGIEVYSSLNMLSPVQCGLIARELKRLSWLAKHEPDAPEMEEYLKDVWIKALAPSEEWTGENTGPEAEKACLRKYRRNFCSFLSFMIDWFSARDDSVTTQDEAVNICGL